MQGKPLTKPNIRRRGRPRKYHADLSRFACPNLDCKQHGVKGAPTLRVKERTGKSEARYRLVCRTCGKTFTERRGTPLYWVKKSTPEITRVLRALVDGNGVRGTSRVCEVDKHTVRNYLRRFGPHAAAVNQSRCQDLRSREIQIDEAWTYITKKQHNLTEQDKRQHPEWGDVWLYLAKDAETKLIPAAMIGNLTQPETERFVDALEPRFAEPFPLVLSDMRVGYAEALHNVQAKYPYLHYVQVEGGHSRRWQTVYGHAEVVDALIDRSGVSHTPNTSIVEAMFGNVRLGNRRMQRKLNGVSKKREMLAHQIALYCAWYNFCKTHSSLRRALQNPNGKRWEQRTPAMAAGLTDRPWTVADLLTAAP